MCSRVRLQTNTAWIKSDVIISLSRHNFERLRGLNFVSLAVSRESKLKEHFPVLCYVAKRNTRRAPTDYILHLVTIFHTHSGAQCAFFPNLISAKDVQKQPHNDRRMQEIDR